MEHLPEPRVESVTSVDERRAPAVPIVGQREVVAVPPHPDDDRADARSRVEPAARQENPGLGALDAGTRERGVEERAALDCHWPPPNENKVSRRPHSGQLPGFVVIRM